MAAGARWRSLAEPLADLSPATDLGLDRPLEHLQRTYLIGQTLAERASLSGPQAPTLTFSVPACRSARTERDAKSPGHSSTKLPGINQAYMASQIAM